MTIADASTPIGIWRLNANSFRLTASIFGVPGNYNGNLVNESGGVETLDSITWNESTRWLEFRRLGGGFCQWYRGQVVEGIFAGRFSHSVTSTAKPGQLSAYNWHVTGWNASYLDIDIVPRVYELWANNNFRGRLRIDRATNGSMIGRMKIYATQSDNAAGEELEYDLEVTQWNGSSLIFIRRDPGFTQVYTGLAQGGNISGTFTHDGTGAYPWSGARAEVLTYGLTPKSASARAPWQHRTRRQLQLLMMAGNPPALSRTVQQGAVMAPFSGAPPVHRDDDPNNWPQAYQVSELHFTYTLPNPYNAANSLTRTAHGYLAVPTSAPDGRKFPAVLAVNGHDGSAYQQMSPDNGIFWYGDAFARRGFVVLALDISHRNDSPLYNHGGDDPAHGNGPHPSIKAAGFDSDWEEDGERAWDALRAVDYLLSLPNVDPRRVLVTGISLGGEITTAVAALDPRLAICIPVGYSPDLGVMLYLGNHECWRWVHADLREYIDVSDLHALIAPRPLIVQTGRADFTFSPRNPPFSADKQLARRARTAYAQEQQNYVHYLHYDDHRYHVGDVNPSNPNAERGVQIPTVAQPSAPGSLTWQTDGSTSSSGATLFDYIAALTGIRRLGDSDEQAGFVSAIAPIKLGTQQVVTATRTESNTLKLISWQVNPDGSVTRSADSANQAGVASHIDIARGSRYVVACRTSAGNLRLISWDISNAGVITRVGDSANQAGTATKIKIAALSDSLFVSACRTAEGTLKLISWRLNNDGSLTRLGDSGSAAGAVSEVSLVVLSTSAGGGQVVTSVRDSDGDLKLIVWEVSAAGVVTRLGDSGEQAGAATMIQSVRDAPGRVVTAVRASANSLKLISWSISGDGTTVTRLGDSGEQAGFIGGNALMNRSSGVLSAVRTEAGSLKLIAWTVTGMGTILRTIDSGKQTGLASLITLCQDALSGDAPIVTAVQTASNSLKLITWKEL